MYHSLKTCFLLTMASALYVYSSLTFAKTSEITTLTTPLKDNLVILQYHHVSNHTPRITSTPPDVFAEHLAYLYEHFNVVALPDAINALQNGIKLPDKSVAITFDDGFDNILINAHPLLRKYDFPYTIFINPALIGRSSQQLTWEEVTQMSQEGVTFANHTLEHQHLLNRQKLKSNNSHNQYEAIENEAQWLTRVLNDISQAEAILKGRLGYSLRYLAYPYGEFNRTLSDALNELDYVGFAQHSGGISSQSDFSALPRYPAAGRYAKLATLKIKLNSLAMPVLESNISDPELSESTPNELRLTLDAKDFNLSNVNCFYQGELQPITINDDVLIIQLSDDIPVGRSRMNCTARSKSEKDRYYWLSQPFFKANQNGLYID